MVEIGSICCIKLYYTGLTGESKVRPVLVIDADYENNLYTIVKITSVGPKNPPTYHDRYKIEIQNWKQYGLDKQSWVKINDENIYRVSGDKFVKILGAMDVHNPKSEFYSILAELLN